MICHGFSLVTNVLIVSCFGQKHLLNALNVNINGYCQTIIKPGKGQDVTRWKMLHHFIVLGVAVCVCVCVSCTYSYSFLFDSPYWQYFASEWHFTRHGYVVTHWLVGCQGQQCCDNGAASAWSILGSCSLETSDSYRQTDRNDHCCQSRIFWNVQIYALLFWKCYRHKMYFQSHAI